MTFSELESITEADVIALFSANIKVVEVKTRSPKKAPNELDPQANLVCQICTEIGFYFMLKLR